MNKKAAAGIALAVNGQKRTVAGDPNRPLLYVLRNDLGLTGAKFGCGKGQCGACSVLMNNEAVRSCQVTLAQAAGKSITTLEGLGDIKTPHPVQAAFIAEQAAQCGYCANGMVMATVALLARTPEPSLDEAKQALAGNLCRCGTHRRILRAVMRASGRAQP
ncbi:(2Fe-2S)-binding protein [Paramagnetospirillum kuznetsovii]|uniref:(2Fe-2S)-binding protein n=1 Tax=Paramagnetospirillum kuznetsovii TaxID=2053833 RepID=A0A364NV94_9PROT|nr:(2Fe-2S)-binding protein [Paramagnetospirillum kuznetsovii]